MEIATSQLRRAFESVDANHGCAGVDGVTLSMFKERLGNNLQILQHQIASGSYQPLPLMKIQVAKKNGEPRGLSIPAVRDRVAQRAVLDIIRPVLEREFEDCSYAYRRGRSVRQVVDRIRQLYSQGYRYVVDADIDAFFDNVDHDLLMAKLGRTITDRGICDLLAMWVRGECWDGQCLTRIEKGIPQGSAVSPVLANLFLDELDEAMLAQGYQYIRYADDYVVLCKDRKDAFEALSLSKQVLGKMHLELDEEAVASFDDGFKYLGVVFLRSLVMKPFETQMKQRKVLSYPGPFDIAAYLRDRQG